MTKNMKLALLFFLFVVLLTAVSSCSKKRTDCFHIPAKIIRYDCDRVIFQILDSTLIGDSLWIDVQTGRQYNNVVSYYNTCKVEKLAGGKKITLYVNIIQPGRPLLQNCAQCEALSQHPPQTMVDFSGMSDISCEIQDHH